MRGLAVWKSLQVHIQVQSGAEKNVMHKNAIKNFGGGGGRSVLTYIFLLEEQELFHLFFGFPIK